MSKTKTSAEDIIPVVPVVQIGDSGSFIAMDPNVSISSMMYKQNWTDEDDVKIGQEIASNNHPAPLNIKISALHLELMARVRLILKNHCE